MIGAEESSSGAGPVADDPPTPEPIRLDGLLLLSNDPANPLHVDGISLVLDGQGVQVSAAGDEPRVLPWTSLATHVVEPWRGEVTPEWWIDPELNRVEDPIDPEDMVTDPDATNRPLPHIDSGALISLQTPFATYRFLVPAGDPADLGPRVAALALSHQGPSGAPSVTTVATRPTDTGPAGGITWRQVQPVLVVLLVAFLVAAVVLILLQSAGDIHLPFLGGANPGSIGLLRRR